VLAAADVYHAMTEARPHREAQLVIAEKTARNHIEHMYLRLGVSTRVEASLYAMRHGLVD
jgi:hypothetical protein